jgi:dTDP-4-dehydrorhamnose reductase
MITLIGHGYIGENIARHLKINSIEHRWICHHEPVDTATTAIINAAGYTGSPNVDACEKTKQQTIQGNVIFPLQLEHKHPNIPIIHISSGCVYTGYKPGGWLETDEPNFDFDNGSFYSASKTLFQKLMQPFLHKSYLLRIRMPFGPTKHEKNLLTKLSNYQQLIDFTNSLSHVDDIAKTAVFMAQQRPEPGIYNVCNPGSATTKQIAQQLNLHKPWMTVAEFQAATQAPRSSCILNTDKLTGILAIQPIETALISATTQYNTTV